VFRAGNNKQLYSGIPKTRTDANLPHVSNPAAERSLDGISLAEQQRKDEILRAARDIWEAIRRIRRQGLGMVLTSVVVSEGAAEPSLIAPTTAACNFFIDVHGVDIYSFKDALI
jgi:hypothetical protein